MAKCGKLGTKKKNFDKRFNISKKTSTFIEAFTMLLLPFLHQIYTIPANEDDKSRNWI